MEAEWIFGVGALGGEAAAGKHFESGHSLLSPVNLEARRVLLKCANK
jgi:hypothetical protein